MGNPLLHSIKLAFCICTGFLSFVLNLVQSSNTVWYGVHTETDGRWRGFAVFSRHCSIKLLLLEVKMRSTVLSSMRAANEQFHRCSQSRHRDKTLFIYRCCSCSSVCSLRRAAMLLPFSFVLLESIKDILFIPLLPFSVNLMNCFSAERGRHVGLLYL